MFYIKRKSDGLYPYVWMCGEVCGCERVDHTVHPMSFPTQQKANEYLDYLIKEYYLEDEYYIEEV